MQKMLCKGFFDLRNVDPLKASVTVMPTIVRHAGATGTCRCPAARWSGAFLNILQTFCGSFSSLQRHQGDQKIYRYSIHLQTRVEQSGTLCTCFITAPLKATSGGFSFCFCGSKSGTLKGVIRSDSECWHWTYWTLSIEPGPNPEVSSSGLKSSSLSFRHFADFGVLVTSRL